MQLLKNVDLRDYSTMRLGGRAAYAYEIADRAELEAAVTWANRQQLPVQVVGTGSNIVWRDEGFDGLLIVNKMLGYEDHAEDSLNHYLTIGAGENWDTSVKRSVLAGLTGIEALSLIPGTVGATPVQNVGAYGQDISQTLSSLEAYDLPSGQFVTIAAPDCAFGYRSSRFNRTDRGRFIITSITLHLTKANPQPPFYNSLQAYLSSHASGEYTPQTIRDAVIAIRNSKLPDPAQVANNGSFFANPVVDTDTLAHLQAEYPAIPHWETAEFGKRKLPAAWLLEQAGFKDYHDAQTGMGTWPAQPLVLVNEHAQHTADLLAFKQTIVSAVQAKFGITLEQEPELLPVTR